MPDVLTPPSPRTGDPEAPGQRLTRLIAEFSSHVQQQLQDGLVWRRWRLVDDRFSPFGGLSAVIDAWQGSTDASVRDCLAALAALGSRRGVDDELAAMVALVLMTGGVCRVAHDLRDLCEPEDVVVAMWMEIRRSEPMIGPSVARLLIKRTRQRLIRDARSVQPGPQVALNSADAAVLRTGSEDDEAISELVDLLTWAERRGVMNEDDVALLAELVDEERAGATRTEALVRAGARRGLAVRTVRRHRQLALEALRRAVPDYVAATA